MKKLILPVIAIALAAAGCGSSHHGQASAKKASPTCQMTDGECLPTGKPTHVLVPALKKGLPFKYQTGGDDGAITQEVTLTKMKTARSITDPADGYTVKAHKGHLLVCVEMRVKNVGTTPGDTYTNAQWFGADGKTEQPSLMLGAGCDSWGMATDMSGQPNPGPGRYVVGSTLYEVPDGIGAIEILGRDGSPLYRLDYMPTSSQIQINEDGQ